MFQQPGYVENVSMRLSEVLADTGVDERIVQKRRRTCLLRESLHTRSLQLKDTNASVYLLGSQSEGTTTTGLQSDDDQLLCLNNFNVIQDWSDWEPGVTNYLMIQDERVSPGYCMLQRLRHDAPLPYNDVPNHHFRDREGRILWKNIAVPAAAAAAAAVEGGVRHGPAHALQGIPGFVDFDLVPAFPCKTWPQHGRLWLNQQGVGQWPSYNMRGYCYNTGCFLVGVGSKGSENEELEWRVSTSLAERCLMFNLSITQIRCYVLMKMILKTFIKPQFEDTVTSYMCKTVLFHCIGNTRSNIWRESNLLVCLSLCLFVLYNSILNEICPHFIIPENNLMRGHIPPESKPYILEILRYIINSEGRALLQIECDLLGERLQLKLNYLVSVNTSDFVSGHLLRQTALTIDVKIKYCQKLIRNSSCEVAIQTLLKNIYKLANNQNNGLDKTACCLLSPRLCTTLGSVLASVNIQQYNAVSAEALTWISLGLNADVASSKLKLASILYCIGETQRAENVLRDIEGRYDLSIVEPVCGCYAYIHQSQRAGFNEVCDNHDEEAIQFTTASCVTFLKSEINCVPAELRYELFRSTQEDLAFRSRKDVWMDFAVVDSLPYLYYLQYKTYSRLRRQDDKQEALSKLVITIEQEPNLGHKETSLNILGQCMEEENRVVDALRCYLLSLNLKGRNNAAKFHICRLLSAMIVNNHKFKSNIQSNIVSFL